MTRLRRRPGTVYRVYGEEEYLAGLDMLADRDVPLRSDEPAHRRGLRRLAGAAALSGAVGAVGGLVGLALVHAHPPDRSELAERSAPSTAMAVRRGSTSATRARRATSGSLSSPSRPGRRRPAESMSVHSALARARRSQIHAPVRMVAASGPAGTPARVMSAVRDMSATAASTPAEGVGAARGAVAEAAGAARGTLSATPAAQPRAQGEFGFER
jgi:hypothetical protein